MEDIPDNTVSNETVGDGEFEIQPTSNHSWRELIKASNLTTSSFQSKEGTRKRSNQNQEMEASSLLRLTDTKYQAFFKDSENTTILHQLLNNGTTQTPTELHRLTKYLSDNHLSRMFETIRGNFSATPLHWAAHNFEIEDSTLSLLGQSCVNFSTVDKDGQSVLIYAVRGRRSTGLLSKIIQHGADWRTLSFSERSPLHFAAEVGNVEGMEFFLKLGLDINGADSQKNTPLHLAVGQGKTGNVLDIVKYLLKNGADVNAKNELLWTPLYALASNKKIDPEGYLESLKYLINNRADVFLKVESGYSFLHEVFAEGSKLTSAQFHDISLFLVSNGYSNLFNHPGGIQAVTPFHLAVYKTELEEATLHLLQQSQANFNAVNSNDESALFYGVRGKRTAHFLKLLTQLGANWKQMDKERGTLLHYAAKWENLEAFKLLLDLGLQINAKDDRGNSPLHTAVEYGDRRLEETVQLLVKNGANTNLTNIWGFSLLHKLASNRNGQFERIMDTFKYLVELGGGLNLKTKNGNTCLHLLFSNPSPSLTSHHLDELMKYFVSKGYSYLLDIPGGKLGATPLHLAAHNVAVKEETLALLRNVGVNLNALDNDGDSVLYYGLIGNKSSKLISSLIKFGADPKHLNRLNLTLLHSAASWGNPETMKVLVDAGLDANAVDSLNYTPLHRALEFGKENTMAVVQLLVVNGADVNASGYRQRTPIFTVTLNKHNNMDTCLQIIKYLIERKADPFSKEKDGRTFLHELLTKDSKLTARQLHVLSDYLTDKGYSKIFGIAENTNGATPLHWAVKNIELEEATLSFWATNAVNLSILDRNGRSVLYYAVFGNRSQTLITSLIRHGVDPNYLSAQNRTLLHIAAELDSFEAANVFLELGLDINTVDTYGDTPLHDVLQYGKKNVMLTVKKFVESGADINATNFQQWTPIFTVTRNKNIDMSTRLQIIRYLIEKKADAFLKTDFGRTFLHGLLTNGTKLTAGQLHDFSKYLVNRGYSKIFGVAEDKYGSTPLHWAVKEMELEEATLDLLQANNANFNLADNDGDAVLYYAVRGNRTPKFLASLIKHGADFRHLNNKNESLLHVATRYGDEEALSLFINMGLNVNGVDDDGETALHYAVHMSKKNVLKLVRLLIGGGANINATSFDGLTPFAIASARNDLSEKEEVIQLLKDADNN